MNLTITVPLAALLLLSLAIGSTAAEVEYQHPDLTIVAVDEPLSEVLKKLSQVMEVSVIIPLGFDPIVNCDVREKPLRRALNTLLSDISYSLEWQDNGERLAGLAIFTEGGDSPAGQVARSHPKTSTATQAVPVPAVPGVNQAGTGITAQQIEQTARVEVGREEVEVRMAEAREIDKAEMAIMREEEEMEFEAQAKENEEREEAEMQALLKSEDLL